ncbi:nuclear transport factor 2 family protein [Bradyrhizobium liaoningense]|uniref:YybH family protein n=1 Tax=Bradyrhizobium liaoningense TaxID=43992 RepID=UPI0020114E58|nr:nuclear transport factor 2 family protein [Bradyrhizobium liaoningense]
MIAPRRAAAVGRFSNFAGRTVQHPFIIERLCPALGVVARCREFWMSIARDDFDPIGAIVDWLDACRRGDLNALLNFYDEGAVLECDCEGVSVTGRNAIAAYWAPKLETNRMPAFTLDDVALTGHGVQMDYQSYEGKPVRLYFRFGSSGKIIYTSCGPKVRSAAQPSYN